MKRPHRESGRGAAVTRQADDREPMPKVLEPQPGWVPELVSVLVDLHRKRASRFAHAGLYARRREHGRYPDRAA
jgi:hypothetical protein